MFSGVVGILISTTTLALSEAESVDSPKMAEGVLCAGSFNKLIADIFGKTLSD